MENRLGTIKDSINIDVNELRDNLGSLNRDKTYLVFCQVG
jgi:rhodanese-related sulfurtransferase